MRKLNVRYLWTAVAAAALTAAAITIPAWASGGGDSTGQIQSQTRSAPLPPMPGAGFALRGETPSAAEIKKNRAKLDEFASCLKDHGLDAPVPGGSGRRPSPPSSSEMQKITKECGAPPAPPAGPLPPLSKKQTDAARKAMAEGNCPPLPAPPARNSR
jgi:hypothetical protein